MIIFTRFHFSIALIGFLSFHCISQTFEMEKYRSYLESRKDMSAAQLCLEYPTPQLADRATFNKPVSYLDSVIAKYNLTTGERELLLKNGFMVSDRFKSINFFHAIESVWHKDLPLFLSTDVFLHLMHRSQSEILKEIEQTVIISKLREAIIQMRMGLASYTNPRLMANIDDVDVYLSVTLNLLGASNGPIFFRNLHTVNKITSDILSYRMVERSIMMSAPRFFDFSQFKPRGHYESTAALQNYFRTMMWLGRTDILLSTPADSSIPPEDIQRQTIDAMLLWELTRISEVRAALDTIDDILMLIVGQQNNVTLANLDELAAQVGVQEAAELLDETTLQRFQAALRAKPYSSQAVLSHIISGDLLSPSPAQAPTMFALLGQRFTLDSYIFTNVVYDKITFDNRKIFRNLPSSLDMLFVLGNNIAGRENIAEIDRYSYARNLSALRYLTDSFNSAYWERSQYSGWLNAIRSLRPPASVSDLPPTMRTEAYWKQKMNTQLGSWAELRHDYILYVAQSYTNTYVCSYPDVYVEPIPAFYDALKRFAQRAYTQSIALNLPDRIRTYYDSLGYVMGILKTVAVKELAGVALSAGEKDFLRCALYRGSPINCDNTRPFEGWLPRLLFYNSTAHIEDDDKHTNYIVADVHTCPTDESGNFVGYVVHVGTGKPNLGVFIFERPDGPMAYVGPCFSYYETTTSNFKRYANSEWESVLNNRQALRPRFVHQYMADSVGNRRDETLGYAITAIDSTKLDFLSVAKGESEIRSILIRNVGMSPVSSVEAQFTGSHGSYFSLVDSLPQVIEPFESMEIHIQYRPEDIGNHEADIIITLGNSIPSQYVIRLNGHAYLNNARLERIDHSLVFNAIVSQPQSKVLRVMNSGYSALTISDISFTGEHASIFSSSAAPPIIIQPGIVYSLSITCSPTDTGTFHASVEIGSNSIYNPVMATPLTAIASFSPSVGYSVSRDTIDFGEAPIDQSLEEHFNIQNTGTAALRILSQRFLGRDSSFFSLTDYQSEISTGRTATFTVVFQPQEAKQFASQLRLTLGDTVQPTRDIFLRAIGFKGPNVSWSLNTLFFDTASIGTHIEKAIIFRNSGDRELHITDLAMLSGTNSMFILQDSLLVQPGGDRVCVVRFSPTVPGFYSDTVIARTNDSHHSTILIPSRGVAVIPTSVSENASKRKIALIHSAFPNPFSLVTTIQIELGKREYIVLELFDVRGNLVKRIVSGKLLEPGLHEYRWSGLNDQGVNVPSGIYFLRLKAGAYHQLKHMTLLR